MFNKNNDFSLFKITEMKQDKINYIPPKYSAAILKMLL